MADVYPVFSSEGLNSQITFNFGPVAYVGSKPIGYLNFGQDPSEVDVYGSLTFTEARDTAAFNGAVIVSSQLVVTEARDAAIFNGVISDPPQEIFLSYSAEGVNSQVTFNFSPVNNRPSGFLHWDLGPYTPPEAYGTLSVIETPDTALFNGALIAASGTLNVTEAADVAAFFGSYVDAELSGNLVYTEPADTAVFDGEVSGNVGQLDATEDPDVAAFTGEALWPVILAATENADSAIFVGELGYISETPDSAVFIGFVMDTPPVPGVPEVLRFGIPVSLSRW